MRGLPVFLVSFVSLGGCTPETASLVDHTAWAQLEPSEDPFDDRPASAVCPDSGWGFEDFGGEPAVEVDTTTCDYASLSQPTRAELRPGDTIQLRLWHDVLEGPEGSAHLAVALDGVTVWETSLAIPGEAGIDRPVLEVDEPLEAGAEVVFHVHNHGVNTYTLIELSRTGLR